MNNAKHTPGPWTVECDEEVTDDLCILGPSPDFRFVATVSRCFQVDRIKDMEQANACLIAAAPDMLAALQDVMHMVNGDYHYDHPTAVLCRAAIAKATGAA